jgi:hypothetical protein
MTFHQARVFALREDSRLVELSALENAPPGSVTSH